MHYFKRRKSNSEILEMLFRNDLQQKEKQRQNQRSKNMFGFLAHGAWEGIGTIFSILSFMMTVVLTIYVFNLGYEQQMANMRTLRFPFEENAEGPQNSWSRTIYIENGGPSTGRGVIVTIIGAPGMECQESNVYDHSPLAIHPSNVKVTSNENYQRCEFYYEYFYTTHASPIVITVLSVTDPDNSWPIISVSGENVIVK